LVFKEILSTFKVNIRKVKRKQKGKEYFTIIPQFFKTGLHEAVQIDLEFAFLLL
jgi:hypothetical protein